MARCPSCGGEVLGRWQSCPLCRVRLEEGAASAGPEIEVFPAVPLRFDRRQLWAAVVALSVLVVVASFAAQALVPNLVSPVRTVWLSVAVLWLVTVAAVQRRRNVGSLVGWLVVLLSLAALAWNRFDGPEFWATTWAIPAICTAANLALGVVLWIVRPDPTDHISKAVLVILIGMLPGLFVLFDWVTNPIPALACVGFSLVLLALLIIFRRRYLADALHRRFHI